MAKVVYFGKHISDKIRDADKDIKDVCVNKYILDKSINYGKQ